jgi:DNA polymerase I-like protein with 3'-5' exonuclease and polymerase domains
MIYTIGCEHGRKSTIKDCLEYFKDKTEIQIDTETTGRDPHTDKIIMLQIGDTDNQWVIDTRNTNILSFKELIETKLCLLQNAKFDYKMLKKVGINLNRIYDTMLAECVLYCGYEKWGYSLDKLSKRYLDIEISKDEREGFLEVGEKPFTLNQIAYGATDVMYLQRIRDKQMHLAETHELLYCIHLENEVVKALGDIEYNGMYLDKEDWSAITKTKLKELDSVKLQLDEIIVGEPKLAHCLVEGIQGDLFGATVRKVKTNYASPKQIKEICTALGFPVESTNDRELIKLEEKHQFFKLLRTSRELSKIISTYGESFLKYINPATGRVHTDFWQVKDTGRVSSGSKDMNAPNVQNIPADNLFRNCFKARPGFKWVSIDYSGQELRLMADGSGEQGFIDVLNRGEDLHCYAGTMMFKKPVTKADKELRNKAKTINFGKPYGMGPQKLADTLSISMKEADELFKEYALAFPTLNRWLDMLGKSAIQNEYSLTFAPCKRRRWYPEVKTAKQLRRSARKGDKATWREIMIIEGQTQRNGGNSPIQGTGADITKEALVGVKQLIKDTNEIYGEEVAYLICTVHDAIDVEVREDLAEQFSKAMAQVMINAGNKYVTKVNMEVDTTITDKWQK